MYEFKDISFVNIQRLIPLNRFFEANSITRYITKDMNANTKSVPTIIGGDAATPKNCIVFAADANDSSFFKGPAILSANFISTAGLNFSIYYLITLLKYYFGHFVFIDIFLS